MESRLEYIFSPSTLISIISAVAWGAIAWTALKWRVDNLETDVKELKSQELHVKIVEMQKDIQYIREMFDRFLEGQK
jgi:hypothetical protein